MSTSLTKALIVVTSHSHLGETGQATGSYLPEVTHLYAALAARGIKVDIASALGGRAPLDPNSMDFADPVNKTFWENLSSRGQLENTLRLADIDPRDYGAILFPGGHGTMWDFPDDPEIKSLITAVYETGGVVAAVCHGPAALVNATRADGQPLVRGKRVAAFSNAEEEAAGLTNVMPFLLESALIEKGAVYTKADLWKEHVVVDGRLVTGQNPASAAKVGAEVAKLLANRGK